MQCPKIASESEPMPILTVLLSCLHPILTSVAGTGRPTSTTIGPIMSTCYMLFSLFSAQLNGCCGPYRPFKKWVQTSTHMASWLSPEKTSPRLDVIIPPVLRMSNFTKAIIVAEFDCEVDIAILVAVSRSLQVGKEEIDKLQKLVTVCNVVVCFPSLVFLVVWTEWLTGFWTTCLEPVNWTRPGTILEISDIHSGGNHDGRRLGYLCEARLHWKQVSQAGGCALPFAWRGHANPKCLPVHG